MRLDALHQTAARLHPEGLAVVAGDGQLTYRELDQSANRLARRLERIGVRRGDRVGVWLPKGGRAIAAFQAILRLGAAYVPLDPTSPPERVAGILSHCQIRTLLTTDSRSETLPPEGAFPTSGIFSVDGPEGWASLEQESAEPLPILPSESEAPAYILYTSGSTGVPKGVCLSHGNALAFIEWAARSVDAHPGDRFSSHAPFHFDLSVFDIYVPALVGASLFVLGEAASYVPKKLVRHLVAHEITVWYSVPSALVLMLEHGELETKAAGLEPRVLVFAGEPFPMEPLRRLRAAWPQTRFFNYFGPTETNVCAAHELRDVPAGASSIPIGRAASGDELWVEKLEGGRADVGEEGELVVRGPTVMLGYWGGERQDEVYRTGDIVRVLRPGLFAYLGRQDGMIKRRGYRIELGEIEAILTSHPSVGQATAVVRGSGLKAQIAVFLVGTAQEKPSTLRLRSYIAERLPRYMFPDSMTWVDALPLTGNGKIDRRRLSEQAEAG